MIPHIARIAAVAGLIAAALLILRQRRWEKQMLREHSRGGSL